MAHTEKTRLILVEDDPFIRESLRIILSMQPDFEVAGVATNGNEALIAVEDASGADVVLMDIRMPVCDGGGRDTQAEAALPGCGDSDSDDIRR